jgi:hypothetical protein
VTAMAKCVRCRRRKAKRFCPALGGELCPLCCGELRDREVQCPPHCPQRERHKPYQDRRTLERRPETPARHEPPGEDVLRDERLAWLALHADAPLAEIAASRPEFSDADAVAAMEYAKDKLERSGGLLLIPGQDRGPRNDAGEAVRSGLDACRYERLVLLAGGQEGYTTDEKIRVLERLILAARSLVRENPAGRIYLERIADQFAAIREDGEKTRILAPR